MILEEVDDSDINKYFNARDIREHPNTIFSRIVNPILYDDYWSLINDFFEHPNAFKLCIYNKKTSFCLFKSNVHEDIRKIKKILDFSILETNLILRRFYCRQCISGLSDFKAENCKGMCFKKRPTELYFCKYKDKIRIAKAFVPYYYEDLFRIDKIHSFYEQNMAIVE